MIHVRETASLLLTEHEQRVTTASQIEELVSDLRLALRTSWR